MTAAKLLLQEGRMEPNALSTTQIKQAEEGTQVSTAPRETQTWNYLKDGCKYTDVFKRNLSLRTKQ